MATATATTQSISSGLNNIAGKIGIFGGTFDPVHVGHLRTAVELGEALSLDTVNLLPCHRPAHRGTPTATSEQRIQMLQLAVADVPSLQVDSREAERDMPSYSVDTLQSYRDENPDARLLFFMGLDAFNKFTGWHRYEDIFKLAHLVVVDRPGSHLDGEEADIMAARRVDNVGQLNAAAGGILLQSVTQFGVSATRIRQLVSQNQDISYLVTGAVRRYIEHNGLYRF